MTNIAPPVLPVADRTRDRWRAIARSLAWGATVCVGLLSLIGCAGSSWPAELACHFRAQYAAVSVVACGLFLLVRSRTGVCLALVVLVLQLWGIVPLYLPMEPPLGSGPALRVMSINVYSANELHSRAIRAIREAEPDVVFVLEVNDRWAQALQQLSDVFPFRHVESRESNFGMAVYSRRPWKALRVLDIGDPRFPILELDLDVDGHTWTLVGAHPVPPRDSQAFAYRNRQFSFLATRITPNRPTLVIGDLNCTTWSPPFQDFLRTSGLRDSRAGYGLQGSWPSATPWLRIAIDHALVTPQLVVRNRHVGPDVGSDHLPLIVELQTR